MRMNEEESNIKEQLEDFQQERIYNAWRVIIEESKWQVLDSLHSVIKETDSNPDYKKSLCNDEECGEPFYEVEPHYHLAFFLASEDRSVFLKAIVGVVI